MEGFIINKKIFTILFILTLALSLSAVYANDSNDTSIDESSGVLTSQDSNEDLSISHDDFLSGENESLSFKDLSIKIDSASSKVDLDADYTFDNESDGDYADGIIIKKNNFIINGNNHVIDAKNKAGLFTIIGKNVTINNLILKNSNGLALNVTGKLIATNNVTFMGCSGNNEQGGAVYLSESTYASNNDKFIDNYAKYGSAIYASESNITINKAKFENNRSIDWSLIYAYGSKVDVRDTTFSNITSRYATAIYCWYGEVNIKKSRFKNLFADVTAGAIGLKGSAATIEDCEFIDVSSSRNGGAVFADFEDFEGSVLVNNTVFENCSSEFGGAYLQLAGDCLIVDSTFKNNYADYDGGAVYTSYVINVTIIGSTFVDNNVNLTYDDYPTYGGAVFIDNSIAVVNDTKFENNHAINASALYFYDCEYHLNNLEFNGNVNPIYTFFDDNASERNNLFGTDNIPEDVFNDTYYPDVVYGPGKQLILVNNPLNFTDLPSKFNLVDYNLVTPVKNQGSMASCWAFGIIGALESALLKATNVTYDFSENNLQNSMLIYSKYGDVSSNEAATSNLGYAYLLNWFGVLPQEYDEYDELGKISPLITTGNDIHVQDIVFIPYTAGTAESIDSVKQAIVEYGALMGVLCFGSTAFDDGPAAYNEETYSLYTPEFQSPNHAICVVGWDDNFSKDNFITKPKGDGAWIIKNSWGTEWGDNGYFYVSYYDQTLCPYDYIGLGAAFVGVKIENTIQYTKNYQYDFIGIYDYVENPGINTQINYFTAYEDDVIAAVGTYLDPDVNFTVQIMINDSVVYTQQCVSQYFGYHTIKLDKYVSIKRGDKFAVLITTNDFYTLSTGSRVKYPEDVSLVIADYVSKLSKDGNVVCVKAYTLPEAFIVDRIVEYYSDSKPFKVNVSQSNVNVTISFENITMTNMSDENGVATFALPMMEHGTHPIFVSYNDSVIVSSVNVLSSIDVPDEINLGYNANANTTITFYQVDGSPLNSITLPLPNEMGTYNLSFTNYLTGEVRNSTINVVSRFIRNDDLTLKYGESYEYVVRVVGDDGKPADEGELVTFKIAGKTAVVETDHNGVVGVYMPPEAVPGTYTITATYKGQTVKNTVIIKQSLSSKKTVSVKITDKKLVLQATLKFAQVLKGNKITFKFMGKTYTAKTDKNGIAKVTINKNVIKKLKAGKKYTVQISYLKDTIKTTVDVKQPLTSKKIVTVKKSAKKMVLQAKLKYGKTPLKKTKITFKFMGKKYTAKTNKYGIAKVTIKKNVIKKLKAGKKYTVQISYLTDTIKTTVKVKK